MAGDLPLPEAPVHVLDRWIAEIAREIGMRLQVYPAWVEAGLMSADHADRRIATISEILVYLQEARRAAAGGQP